MTWSELSFGEHKGKTLPQVVLSDPDWFFHMVEKGAFQNRGRLAEEARTVDHKARRIRIPSRNNEDLVAEYAIHLSTGTFGRMDIVPRSQPEHKGSSPTQRKDVIDLSFPRQYATYDKLGCWLLLGALKFYVFQDSKIRLTRKRCEEFFDNDANFVLGT